MDSSVLSQQLGDSDKATRRLAAERLSQNMELAAEVADELVAHAGDDDRTVAEYCVAALEELGPPALSQLDSLARLAEAKNSEVAYWAVTLLGRAGELAGAHAATLGSVVAGDAAPAVRERAAWALGRLGAMAAPARADLEAAAEGDLPSLARTASKSLAKIAR